MLNLVKRFASLDSPFHTKVQPTALTNPYWIHINSELANSLNINNFGTKEWLNIIGGSKIINDYSPLASLYAGHQFGVWVPQLGDGRAIYIAEHKDQNGEIWELQTKGAGTTPFSRMGDGKAVLRSSIREYLCSHAMKHLNIPTTHALAIVGSKDKVYRERIETAAIVLRVAKTFIRFGHFEVLASRGLYKELKILINFVIDNFFPYLKSETEDLNKFI